MTERAGATTYASRPMLNEAQMKGWQERAYSNGD
jgi:hypothetical protein